jgi:hypothetical protein
MEKNMTTARFEFGDRVRHTDRPEWGIGSVVKAEDATVNGQPSQRLFVRFPGAGVKTLSTAHALLERVPDTPAPATATAGDENHRVADWDRVGQSDWLAAVAERKIEEVMVALPEAAKDPFSSLTQRLKFTLRLYRFERTGRSLVEWAVAQTGLDDPLSRFNRHLLERFFDRWASNRDAQLARLLQEAEGDSPLVESLLADAPAAAVDAVRRLSGVR